VLGYVQYKVALTYTEKLKRLITDGKTT
jgi:hypothetical protein